MMRFSESKENMFSFAEREHLRPFRGAKLNIFRETNK